MNRYSKGQIYKIVDVGYNKMYIGSTCEDLSKRMERHRTAYKRYLRSEKKDTKVHLLFDEYGVENCKIELIEEYACSNKMELLRQEGHHIRENDCVNKRIEGRTPQERYKDNPEYYKEKSKIHYQNNKDGYIKEYNDNNREHLCEVKRQNYHDNKERYQEQNKNYHQTHANSIYARKSKKVTCCCGAVIAYGYKAQHCRSQKHQDWLKQQESEKEPELEKLD